MNRLPSKESSIQQGGGLGSLNWDLRRLTEPVTSKIGTVLLGSQADAHAQRKRAPEAGRSTFFCLHLELPCLSSSCLTGNSASLLLAIHIICFL